MTTVLFLFSILAFLFPAIKSNTELLEKAGEIFLEEENKLFGSLKRSKYDDEHYGVQAYCKILEETGCFSQCSKINDSFPVEAIRNIYNSEKHKDWLVSQINIIQNKPFRIYSMHINEFRHKIVRLVLQEAQISTRNQTSKSDDNNSNLTSTQQMSLFSGREWKSRDSKLNQKSTSEDDSTQKSQSSLSHKIIPNAHAKVSDSYFGPIGENLT